MAHKVKIAMLLTPQRISNVAIAHKKCTKSLKGRDKCSKSF